MCVCVCLFNVVVFFFGGGEGCRVQGFGLGSSVLGF